MLFRRLLAPVLFLLAALPASAENAAAPLTISGQLLDEIGRPIVGGRVEAVPAPDRATLGRQRLGLEPEPAPSARTETDAAGLFRLAIPEPGHWRLRFQAADRLGHEETLPVVEPLELGPLRGQRSRIREAEVLDAAGRPLAGARVTVFGTSSPPITVGADGRVRIEVPRLTPGGEMVVIVAPGQPPFSATLRGGSLGRASAPPPPDPPKPPLTIQDASGRPVPNAVFWLWGQPINATDAQGRGYPPLIPGRERSGLEVTAAGRLSGKFEGRFDPGGPTLRLASPVRLAGRVRTAVGGQPVIGALVWPSSHPGEVAKTGAEGRFELLASDAGRPSLELVVVAPGFVGVRLDVAPGGSPAEVRLVAAATVSGVVVDAEGKPQAGFLVSAERERSDEDPAVRPAPRFRTAADGRFTLPGLAPGEAYGLVAERSEVARGRLALAALGAGESRSGQRLVVTPYRSAKGRVVDAAGEPIAGATATLTRVEPPVAFYGAIDWDGGMGQRRDTDDTGRFRIPGLEPGRHDLHVDAPGYAAVTVRGLAIPAAGGEVDLGVVHLSPAVELHGRIVNGDGEPVADAEISFLPSHFDVPRGPSEGGTTLLYSSADGTFTVPDLTPGTSVGLTVSRPGFVRTEVPGVRVPREDELVIALVASGRVTGRVVDGEGRGIEGAQVATAEARWEGATTDSTGAFAIEGLSAGPLQLLASARGYLDPPPKTIEIAPGETVAEVIFELERGATVSGRVLGPEGSPLEDAHVFLRDFTGLGSEFATTDADGRYRLDGVPAGDRRFGAGAQGLLDAIRSLTVRSGENNLDFRLERGLALRGRVVGPEGQPVDQGEVTATVEPGGHLQQRAAVKPDGSFEVTNLKPGRYRVRADSLDYAPGELAEPVTVGPGSVEGLVVPLSRGALVVGRVTGLGFDQVTELQVVASSLDGSTFAQGQVDYQGGFVIKNVTPGAWTVMASAGNRQAFERVDVEAGVPETRVEIEFGGYILSGRVTRSGRPVTNAGVLANTRQELAGGYATTDHDGRFEIHDLAAGEYQVAVATSWSGFAHSERVVIDGDREIAIEVVGLNVSGRVVTKDGDPLPSTKLTLRPLDGGDLGSWGTQGNSDEAGRFRFTDVSPGRYVLQGEKEGYAQGETPLEIAEADAETELRLSPAPGLVLEVRTSRGPLPSGASLAVAAVDAQGRTVFRGHGEADDRGRVRLPSVPLGSWTLWLSTHGQAVTRLAVTNPGPPVPVQMAPGAELQVEVPALRASNEIARLTVIGPDGQSLPTLHQGLELTYERMLVFGQASVSEVPAGRWTLKVVTAGGESWEKAVDVAPPGARVVVE